MKGRLLQQLFTAQAESRPDADAIVLRDQKITYGRLEAISNQLARALKNIGCRPSDRVAILMPKSIPAISAILGILKADCVYVPVDISSPPARLRQIAAAIEAACIITHGNTANQLSASYYPVAGSGGRLAG